jgi:hypothetical protein
LNRVTPQQDWREFLNAAPRKVKIAQYHLENLRSALTPCPPADTGGLPPIDVQAHFEGVLFAVIAAASQIEEAVRYAKRLGRDASRRKILESISHEEFRQWYRSPLSRDLQAIRNAGFHRSYEKSHVGERWFVNERPRPKSTRRISVHENSSSTASPLSYRRI